MEVRIDLSLSQLSWLTEPEGLGWQGLVPGLQSRDGWEAARFSDLSEDNDGTRRIQADYPCGLREELILTPNATNGLTVRRRLRNTTDTSILIRSAGICANGPDGGPRLDRPFLMHARYAHLDNLRTESYPKCRTEYPFLRALPWQNTEFGNQESQAAPYMVFTTDRQRNFLLEAQLDQRLARCSWELGLKENGGALATYGLNWRFPGTDGVTLQAGDELELEPVCYRVFANASLEEVLRVYGEMVAQAQGWAGRGNPLNRVAFYCSWNYGIMRDISHESLLKTARFTREHLPGISTFLIDGGWVPWEAGKGPHLGNFNVSADDVYDHAKFPHGMKGVADAIRATGLKPALHWTPFVRANTRLAQAHGDWLCRDAKGEPYRIGVYGYLDYSLPEVQAFFHHVFQTIFREWGFDSMKMDFWSQSVESNSIRYRNGGTGIHWRNWLLAAIESYLPADGFLMTCVATAMGNPFLGKHARTYRCGIDVGNCDWREHLLACSWAQPLLAVDERDMALRNLDGFGISDKLTDAENLHRLTYGFISMGSLEVDGRFEELSAEHVDWLRRLTSHIDRGHAVRTVDDQVHTGVPLPKCLWVDYPEESPTYRRGVRKHIALFNWADDDQFIGATGKALGLAGATTVRDFWTDELKTFPPAGIFEMLPARSARLYELTETGTRPKRKRK